MNKEQLDAIVERVVESEFIKSNEMISCNLAAHMNWEDGWERTVSQAAINAVKVSTRMSVQIILDILLQTGIFRISESEVSPNLTVLQGGMSQESHGPKSPQ